MKAKHLFPRGFRVVGLILAIPGLVLGALFLFYEYTIPNFWLSGHKPDGLTALWGNFTNELALALTIVGLIFISFSKLKVEDELTAQTRLNALYWAVLINYSFGVIWVAVAIPLSALGILTNEDGIPGLYNLLAINLIMPLVIFIARFYYLLYKNKNEYPVLVLRFLPDNKFNKVMKVIAAFFALAYFLIMIYQISKPFFSKEPEFMKYLYFLPYVTPFLLLFWVFTKEPIEDEYVGAVRLAAMQIAIYVNYGILFISNLLFYLFDFAMIEMLNFCTIPIIFIIVFKYKLMHTARHKSSLA